MNTARPFGLSLFTKDHQETKVLKDLLQYLKSTSRGTGHSFSYIVAETSLHPQLTLWENIQVEIGPTTFRDFQHSLKPELSALLNLIQNPDVRTCESQNWEKFLVSLIKGIIAPSHNLLIDLNEDLLSPMLIQHFKKCILEATSHKQVYLASSHSSLWLDCAHTLVTRSGYTFETKNFDSEKIKKYWAA